MVVEGNSNDRPLNSQTRPETDLRFQPIIDAWAVAYLERVGCEYAFEKADFGQLKSLLARAPKLTCDTFIKAFHDARAAAAKSTPFHCSGKSGSLKSFCAGYNEIRGELGNLAAKEAHRRAQPYRPAKPIL